MLEQLTPFRLCSTQPLNRRPLTSHYQRPSYFTPRNNPHPRRVRHFNGIHNMPICYVAESLYNERYLELDKTLHPALLRSNTFTGLPTFRYRNIPYKEKAIPKLGLFPIQEPWRRELHALTECVVAPVLEDLGKSEDISKLIECHPYPICRPITAWMGSEMFNIKNKNMILPNREKLRTPKFTPVPSIAGHNYQLDESFTDDFESQVFALLGQVLQCRDVESVKLWLATANDREKASVMTILKTVFESKIKNDAIEDETKGADRKNPSDESECPSFGVDEEEVEHNDEADRLLIHSRQSTRAELSRPKTQASKIRPQTANSFVSIPSSPLTKKPTTAPIYLRYKSGLNTKSVQTDETIFGNVSDDDQ